MPRLPWGIAALQDRHGADTQGMCCTNSSKAPAGRAQSPAQPHVPARTAAVPAVPQIPRKAAGWVCPCPQPRLCTILQSLGRETRVHIVTLWANRVGSLQIKIFFPGKWHVIKTETFCGSALAGVTSAGDGLSRERKHHPSPACSLVMSWVPGLVLSHEPGLGQKTEFSPLAKLLSKSRV